MIHISSLNPLATVIVHMHTWDSSNKIRINVNDEVRHSRGMLNFVTVMLGYHGASRVTIIKVFKSKGVN